MECFLLYAKCWADWKTLCGRRLGEQYEAPIVPIRAMVGIFSDFCRRPVTPPIWYERFTRNILLICFVRGENLERS